MADAAKKFYCLVMFPYPSGDKLHVGHWYNYGPVDSYARYMQMKGFRVFEPFGFDSFGLPAENYAIKTGVPPKESTEKNVEYMRKQIRAIGTMYDWSKEVVTSSPEYYNWTQWVFLELYRRELAYKKKAPVNWCPKCQTVLANEQVSDGRCERCGSEVTKKELTQWFFNIKEYAEDLLQHEGLDWPEKTILMQKNWIGKSVGCDVSWEVDGHNLVLDTFTTTVDTVYGVTFVVISPEHPELKSIVTDSQRAEVEQYIEEAKKRSDIERMAEDREKTGVFTGSYVINPFNGEKVPLWVADYVLMNYGTGVVMGVPAHDQRDMDFAEKYMLKIVQSVVDEKGESFVYDDVDKYNVKGRIIDSGEFTDLPILEGREKMIEYMEKKKIGRAKIQYKLRDWLISRQRYWGAPIPIVYDPEGNAHPVPEEHLPWMLPTDVDYLPKGKAPLASSEEFVARTEKIFGKGWRPEVDTMDTFVDSSWYFLRYPNPQKEDGPFDKELVKKWLPVDMYVGGPEHACMHLLYARFIHKVLMDDKKAEPFKRLVHQGLITKDGAKMSKSKGNVVSPDEFVEKYGSDIFRMYLMFMGPFTEGGDWSDRGITGIARFADRVWNFIHGEHVGKDSDEVLRALHGAIKKASEDMEKLQFNTVLAGLMSFINVALAPGATIEAKKQFLQLLAPLAPHLAEECWEFLGENKTIFDAGWPSYDQKYLVAQEFELVVQVNGKVRAKLMVPAEVSKEDALKLALENENVKSHLEGKQMKKEIYVPGKLVNLVVS